MLLYICTKCHDNILDGIKVIKRTRFSFKKSNGHNSAKDVNGVTVLVLCTLFGGGL